MTQLYHLLTFALLLLNIAGLTALATRLLPQAAIARAGGLLLLCLGFFFIEHFGGLGQLNWLWPFSSSAAVAILYHERARLRAQNFWRSEMVFILAFTYGMMWRWIFPDVYASSEKMTDLFFIGNYYNGDTLPPVNHWYPTTRFDFYYAFQHYAAALMGRILGLGIGLTYNIAFAVLMALTVTLAWDFITRYLPQPRLRLLVIATLVFGGTGVNPIVDILYQPEQIQQGQAVPVPMYNSLWSGVRFIGSFDRFLHSPLFTPPADPPVVAMDLPAENFGYQFFLGDYHPPLGGFFLLMLAVALIGIIEAPREKSNEEPKDIILCQSLLTLTLPASIAINTWALPPQALLVGSWLIWRLLSFRRPHWPALFLGGLGGTLLLYPFLAGFAAKTLVTPIKLVSSAQHTPLPQFLAQHWPVFAFLLLGLGQKNRERRFFGLFTLAFVAVLLLAEFIYIDDPTGDQFERTNTTMKWWGWMWTGAAVTMSVYLLSSASPWRRRLTIVVLLLINIYAIDVVHYLLVADKGGAGLLAADNVYTRDPAVRDMFRFLKQAPDGIVLENVQGDLINDSGAYALFAVKPVLLGWPLHLVTWTGGNSQIWIIKNQIENFYAGQLPNAAAWLIGQKVRYVVWNGRDDAAHADQWSVINRAISDQYQWMEFLGQAEHHIGFWVRLPEHSKTNRHL